MDASELDRCLAELKERLAKLPPQDRERALDGFAQVLTLLELPREAGGEAELTIGLKRGAGVTHLSG